MAGEWIKIELSTADKPEVLRIARLLHIDKDAAFGKLIRVWAWFDRNSVDGVVDGVVDDDIDSLCNLEGFASALISVGWLEFDPEQERITLPNFDRHNGETAKKRTLKNERQARWRDGKKDNKIAQTDRQYIPEPVKKKVKQIDQETCVYCGFNTKKSAPAGEYVGAIITLDHIFPVARGGQNSIQNLVCACSVCNGYKGNSTPEECGLEFTHLTPERREIMSTVASTGASTREEKRRNINPLSLANPLCDDVVVGPFPDITELPQWLHDSIRVKGVTQEYIGHAWPIVACKLKEQSKPETAKTWAAKIVTMMVRGSRNGWDKPNEGNDNGNKRQTLSRTQGVVDELDRIAQEDIEQNGFAETLDR